MPVFAYKAKTSPDRILQGTLEAVGKAQAVSQLQAMGYSLLSVEEATEGRLGGGAWSWQRLRRVKTADLAMFWRQLASMLEAGLPLVKALETVQQQTENSKLAEILSMVRGSVENASSFSQALSRFPNTFNVVSTSIVASGEESGTLAQVTGQLAVKLEKEQDLRGKLRAALMYPAFLLTVGVAVITVLVAFVIPRFAILFQGMGQQLPLPTRMLLAISRFAQEYGWLVAVGAAAAALGVRQAVRTGPGRLAWNRLQLHLPVIGKVVRRVEMARFAHTFGTLCANGVHILPALEISSRTTANRVIALEIAQVRDRVAKGSRLEAALRKGRYFPPALVNMVAIGEDSSSLDKMLEKVATVFERETDRVVGSLTKLLESVLILVLGAMVALIVAAILLPIFQATAFVD